MFELPARVPGISYAMSRAVQQYAGATLCSRYVFHTSEYNLSSVLVRGFFVERSVFLFCSLHAADAIERRQRKVWFQALFFVHSSDLAVVRGDSTAIS